MKKRTLRMLALVLSLVMVFGTIPAGAVSVKDVANAALDVMQTINQNVWSAVNQLRRPVDNDTVAVMRVEDHTTVTDGTDLRAVTYATGDGEVIKYLPVTLYDYDAATINNATHQVEVNAAIAAGSLENLTQWNGIYFSDGTPAAESSGYGEKTENTTTVDYDWLSNYRAYTGGDYYYKIDNVAYVVNGLECKISLTGSRITYTWTINTTGGDATVTGQNITLYSYEYANSTKSLGYAAWNWWNKKTIGNTKGQYIYSGLVKDTLDANKNIVFNKPDAGIFNSDSTVKTIYTAVEMPFLYVGDETSENYGYYIFDASLYGVYFHEDSAQGSTTAKSGGRLYLNTSNTQWNNHSNGYPDGCKTVWLPFNDGIDIDGERNCNYHFGMSATVPFNMTANGRMKASDDNSTPIKFTFSGDDDVWIFIDGQLVVDLGGIHNRLDAEINFAENTITLSANNNLNTSIGNSGNGLNPKFKQVDGKFVAKLFNETEGDGLGVINHTRASFSATDAHELTIFYLERGGGSSNAQIKFNLPMKDVVSVTKRADKSMTEGGDISPLTDKEQAVVDEIDFGFTIYKDGVELANTSYNLLNANGQVIGNPSTDKDGHFTLRNGQTARFSTEIEETGSTYKVVEDSVESIGFKTPSYTYQGTAAYNFTVGDDTYTKGDQIPATSGLTSATITAKGSDESEDSLTFICQNYFDANLPNPSSRPVDDKIVLDYGLAVEIDALANDVYRGDTIELTEVTGAQYGTANIVNGKIQYQLTKPLTGIEVLTYTATVTGTGNSGTETTTESESNKAYIYIIPASTMYYEQDFSDLVKFTGDWQNVGTSETANQEPGVVGTVGDSPYGSDVAYLGDNGDSNGSSKYVNTADASASFSYTFTGTATSFFARTTNDSAYIRVQIQNEQGEVIYTAFRDTSYKTEDNDLKLYNIPVFTYEADNYGTYTVEVSIAKGQTTETGNNPGSYGCEFWLDGIRVVNPLNPDDTNYSVAQSAYATDGEANMTYATLRDKLLTEHTTVNDDGEIVWNSETGFVVFTDSNGEVKTASEYESNGPKEEVYLNNGQSVSFSLTRWDTSTNKVYLGIKAPTGSGTVNINGNIVAINNAADCYYDITRYATLVEEKGEDNEVINVIATFKITDSDSLISVTNIKVSGNAAFEVIVPTDENVDGSEG